MIDLENAYQWLNLDLQSALSPPMRILRQKLHECIDNGDVKKACELLDRLSSFSELNPASDEKAEIMLECARTYFWLGGFSIALRYLQEASRYYQYRKHNLAVTLWMHGCVLWQIGFHQEEAISTWQRSYNIFRSLAGDYDSLQDKISWYAQRCKDMEKSLAESAAML